MLHAVPKVILQLCLPLHFSSCFMLVLITLSVSVLRVTKVNRTKVNTNVEQYKYFTENKTLLLLKSIRVYEMNLVLFPSREFTRSPYDVVGYY